MLNMVCWIISVRGICSGKEFFLGGKTFGGLSEVYNIFGTLLLFRISNGNRDILESITCPLK
jgi:hypothetical protein